MFNQQVPEKRVKLLSDLLSVHSIFHTIQGEGPFAGTPAVFLRLAGCNLQCPLCDTDYTNGRRNMSHAQIFHQIEGLTALANTTLVVITGGEPFRQNITKLLDMLVSRGYFVQIETNGTFEPSYSDLYEQDISKRKGVYIVCSPKAGKVHSEIHKQCCAYKYVGAWNNLDPSDGLPTHPLEHPSSHGVPRPRGNKLVYLQPTDHKNPAVNKMSEQAVVKSCLKHGYILQLQIHKIIGVE